MIQMSIEQLEDLIQAVDCWRSHISLVERQKIVLDAIVKDTTPEYIANAFTKTRDLRADVLTHKISLLKMQKEGHDYAY